MANPPTTWDLIFTKKKMGKLAEHQHQHQHQHQHKHQHQQNPQQQAQTQTQTQTQTAIRLAAIDAQVHAEEALFGVEDIA